MASNQSNRSGARCRVRLIGPFGLSSPDGQAIPILGRRTRGVLAYLLLTPGQTAKREKLAGLFWGDRGDAQARASLRQCLHQLKGALPSEYGDLVVATRESVSLAEGAFDCDMKRLLDRIDTRSWDDAVRQVDDAGLDRLLEDLDLPGDFRDWLEVERARFDVALGAALANQISQCEAVGDWAAVKALASAWLRRDPVNEVPVAALIRAEMTTGSVVAAHRQYQAFRTLLAAELGVEPGPLVEAAIQGKALDLPPPNQAPAALVSMEEVAIRPRQPTETVLAVLAFENLSSDPELGFFCDGISEEIQCTVARGSELKVVARASSFQLRGKEMPVAEVATALGASHLLYGSVRRSGQQVRISAELVDSVTAAAIWSDRYDGNLEDVFALQEVVAAQVTQALRVALVPMSSAMTLSSHHYEMFLRARGLLAAGDLQYDDSASEAAPLLEAVTAAAPNHAPAWEQLAIARSWILGSGRDTHHHTQAIKLVVEAAQTALRLDPRCVGARLAQVHLEPWAAYQRRENLLLEALDLSPRDPAVLTDMSQFCWSVGRFRESLTFAERACELNPLMPAARLKVAQMLIYVDDYEGAIRMHQELRIRWPRNAGIIHSLLNSAAMLGYWDVYDEAVADIGNFTGWQSDHLRAGRAFGDTLRSRDPAKVARRVSRYLEWMNRIGTLPLEMLTSIAALVGADKAFDLSDRVNYDIMFEPGGNRSTNYWPGGILAKWSVLNASPRLVGLCARLGLCDYWVATDQWPDCASWVPYDLKGQSQRSISAESSTGPENRQALSNI